MLKCDRVTDFGRAIHCQFRQVNSKLGKTAQVHFNRAKQLNRRRQSTVSMPGKRSQAHLNRKPKPYWFTDALVYTIAQGAQWLSGRVLDSRPKDRGFEPHRRHCVVVLEQDTFILA